MYATRTCLGKSGVIIKPVSKIGKYWKIRLHWYNSSLLHSNFQSWQMRSLPTLDIDETFWDIFIGFGLTGFIWHRIFDANQVRVTIGTFFRVAEDERDLENPSSFQFGVPFFLDLAHAWMLLWNRCCCSSHHHHDRAAKLQSAAVCKENSLTKFGSTIKMVLVVPWSSIFPQRPCSTTMLILPMFS